MRRVVTRVLEELVFVDLHGFEVQLEQGIVAVRPNAVAELEHDTHQQDQGRRHGEDGLREDEGGRCGGGGKRQPAGPPVDQNAEPDDHPSAKHLPIDEPHRYGHDRGERRREREREAAETRHAAHRRLPQG